MYRVKLCVSPFFVHSVHSVLFVPLYQIRTLWYCTGVPDRTIARVRFPLTRKTAVSIDTSNQICFDSTARVAAYKCFDIDRARVSREQMFLYRSRARRCKQMFRYRSRTRRTFESFRFDFARAAYLKRRADTCQHDID